MECAGQSRRKGKTSFMNRGSTSLVKWARHCSISSGQTSHSKTSLSRFEVRCNRPLDFRVDKTETQKIVTMSETYDYRAFANWTVSYEMQNIKTFQQKSSTSRSEHRHCMETTVDRSTTNREQIENSMLGNNYVVASRFNLIRSNTAFDDKMTQGLYFRGWCGACKHRLRLPGDCEDESDTPASRNIVASCLVSVIWRISKRSSFARVEGEERAFAPRGYSKCRWTE